MTARLTWTLGATLALAFVPAEAGALPPRGDTPAVLPLRSVVLYESGVGYFERRGEVQRNRPLSLLVPRNHLDDALLTLVVLTSGGARVGAVTFPSVLAPEAALAESPAPLELFSQDQSILPLISALAGVQAVVVTRDGERVSGRVVGTARVQETAPPEVDLQTGPQYPAHPSDAPGTIPVPVLVFLTDGGALRWFALDDLESVGPADEPSQTALDRAVAALAQRAGEAQESLGVSVREGGDLAVGYLAEAPVWRVSYRAVFQDGQARLQGWALVHNDTDEDWKEVEVELVEGQPNSYLFPFVTPRFRHREVLPAEEGLEAAPQLAGTNADLLAGSGSYGVGAFGYGMGGGGSGYGFGSGGLGAAGHLYGSVSGERASSLIDFGQNAAETAAAAEQRRELLAYRATEPLTLGAHQSALVPILDQAVKAERISLVDLGLSVRAAMRFENDTGFALREGPLALFEGGFAGQSWLPRLYAGEKRVLPHGADLDVAVSETGTQSVEETQVVRWIEPPRRRGQVSQPGRLEEHYVSRVKRTYQVASHAGSSRTVFFRMPALVNGRVVGSPAELLTAEDGFEYYHVRLDLPAGVDLEPTFTTEEGLMRSWDAGTIDAAVLRDLAETESLAAATRDVLTRAAAEYAEAEARGAEADGLQGAVAWNSNQIARHRLDLQSLGGSGADEDVATEIAERLRDAGRELDELDRQQGELRERARTARERGVALLRTLAPSDAE